MDIKRSDFILILNLEDIHGQKMRVADTAEFTIRVWTNDPTHYLTFKRRDIISDDYNDRIAIDKMQMECLHSGVVVYDYDYSKWNADFSSTDEKYNKVKTVVTDVYWRNVINADNPCNVVNYQTIEHIYDLIESERLDREQEFHELKDYVGKDFTDKLNAEIKRSNEVDIEFHKLIKTNKEECDTKNTELNDKIDKEIQRSNSVDIEIFNLIKGNADSGKEVTDSITDSLNAEIARSSQKDADLENAINGEITRATNAETVIDTKLEGEIERAKTAEGAIRDAVENERDRAIAKETLINDTLTSEIARAKQVESDITTSLQSLKTAVNEEKQRSADKDTEHTNSLNQLTAKIDTEIERAKDREEHINDDLHSEIDRAKAEEARIENLINSNADADNELSDKLDAEIDRAKQVEKDLNDSLQSEITRSTNKDAELAALIADNSTLTTDEVERATNAEKAITDALNAEISRSTDKDTELTNSLTIEANRAKAEEGRIEAKIDTNSSKIDSEIERAKLVEKDITEKLQSLKSSVSDKNTSTDDAIKQLQADLILEVNRAEAADKTNSDAIAVINGDSSTVGSIAHSLYHAKHYTDDEIEKAKEFATGQLQFALESYATKIEVDNRIKAVVGTAPEALDTLGEIAEVLNGNGDAITAINGVLAGKANSSDVYTKSETDNRINVVNDALTAEANRAKAKESDLNTAITSEISRSTAADNKLTTDLQTETDRAKAAEKSNADAIAILNGGEEVIGSVAHGVADAKHYTDDEIAKLRANQNVALSNMATKNEVAEVDGKLTSHIAEADTKFATKTELNTIIENIDLTEYYTKSEVDNLIDNVDVTDQLTNYYTKSETYNKTEIDTLGNQLKGIAEARLPINSFNQWSEGVAMKTDLALYPKKTETTAIKDENGNIITEMVIDNSSADNSVEVYTKEQCDERFAKVWSGTEAEYNALTTKDSSTLYIIL